MKKSTIPQQYRFPNKEDFESYLFDPAKIAKLISPLTREYLFFQKSPHDWSINTILVHMADTDLFFCMRMKTIIAEEKPILTSFDQNIWENRLLYEKQNGKEALSFLIAQRKYTHGLLTQLPASYWGRVGIHEDKVVTLHDMFKRSLHHVSVHLEQIKSCIDRINGSRITLINR